MPPNDNGYRKMSDSFFGGIQRAVSAGWVEDPDDGSTECTDTAGRWTDRGVIAPGVGASFLDVRFADTDGDRRDDYLVVDGETGTVCAWLNRGGDSGSDPGWVERGRIASGGVHGVKDGLVFANVDWDRRADYLVVKPDHAVDAWLNPRRGQRWYRGLGRARAHRLRSHRRRRSGVRRHERGRPRRLPQGRHRRLCACLAEPRR